MSENSNHTQQLEKARLYAYLSFCGLLVPVAGIVLSLLSLYTLNTIKQVKDDERTSYDSIKVVADTGLRISGVLVVITFVAGAVIGFNYIQQQNKLNKAQQQYINALVEQETSQ